MADFAYPIRALMEECSEAMASAVGGATAEHKFGRKHEFANDRPPRYVWVPMRARERSETPAPTVEAVRAIGSEREHFVVGCWGRDYDEVWAMRRNLFKALHDSARADIRPEGGEWERASAAWNQKGELFIAEFSIGVPYIDAFTALADDVEEPEAPTALPLHYESDIQQTSDVTQPGEIAVTVTAPDT